MKLVHKQFQILVEEEIALLIWIDYLSVICDYYASDPDLHLPIKVTLFTECHIGRNLYRAHPAYKQQGPWFDFAMVCWYKETYADCNIVSEPALRPDEPPNIYLNHHYTPVCIRGFFQSSNMSIPCCVVETFEYQLHNFQYGQQNGRNVTTERSQVYRLYLAIQL